MPGVARRQDFVQGLLRLLGRRARKRAPVANQPAERLVVFPFVFNRLAQNLNAGLVAEFPDLPRVLGDIAALVQFQPPQRHSDAAGTIRQAIQFAGRWSFINRLRAAQFANAAGPELGVMIFGRRQSAERGASRRIGLAPRQRVVGAVSVHLRLPVAFENFENAAAIAGGKF